MKAMNYSTKVNILVIDDEVSLLQLIATVLELAGYKATVASSGEEGVARFREASYDLVISDLNMPGMDGWQVAKAIKKMNPGVPLIVATAEAVQMEQRQLQNAGVDLLLAKPFDIRQLRNVVNEALELKVRETQS